MVEPVDPFQSGEFDRFEVPPWSAPMNDLDLVATVDRFGVGIVITVADTSVRRLYASRSEYRMETYWADSTGRRNTVNHI